jgi:uncharacterized SAM-dependent methyltransferase
MKIEVVLTEADIAQEFIEAIEARDLPEKFFFCSPRSAAEWTRLSSIGELYGGLVASWNEIAADAPGLIRGFGRRVPVISFGAGDGARDRVLLGALKDAGLECFYFPVDASQPMLEIACAAAGDDDIETVGIKADISSPMHLIYAADAAEPARLFIMSGNTMGAFDPLAEIRYVAQCMKPEDRLIIDGEIYEEKVSLARRDNPPVREFLSALLSGVGIGQGSGEIRFNQKSDERREGLRLITRYFHAEHDVEVTAAGTQITLERGERLGLNFQYVYTPEAFAWLLHSHGGLEILKEYRSSDGRFLTAVCSK